MDFIATKTKERILADLDMQLSLLEGYPYHVVDRVTRGRIISFLEWLRPLQ